MARITVAWCAECRLYTEDLERVSKPCGLANHFTSSGKVPLYRKRIGWRCETCNSQEHYALGGDLYFDHDHYRDHIQLDHLEF